MHPSKSFMFEPNFEGGGTFYTTISGWYRCCRWDGGDGMTLRTCLDWGGTGGGGGAVAVASCFSSGTAWYWTQYGYGDCTMGTCRLIPSLASCASILASYSSDARWLVSIVLQIRFWL